MMVVKAIAETTTKAILQYTMQQELGDLGGLAATIYATATTAADLRSCPLVEIGHLPASEALSADGHV